MEANVGYTKRDRWGFRVCTSLYDADARAAGLAHNSIDEGTWMSVTTGQLGTSSTGIIGTRDPLRPGSLHGPQARSRDANGDQRSEIALDGDEDRATVKVGGPRRRQGRRLGQVAPMALILSDADGDR